jgi:hypothetical protein
LDNLAAFQYQVYSGGGGAHSSDAVFFVRFFEANSSGFPQPSGVANTLTPLAEVDFTAASIPGAGQNQLLTLATPLALDPTKYYTAMFGRLSGTGYLNMNIYNVAGFQLVEGLPDGDTGSAWVGWGGDLTFATFGYLAPEPSSVALLLVGSLVLYWRQRR